METIPAKIDKIFISQVAKLGNFRLPVFILLLLLIAVLGALLWGAAAIGSSRQFRLLSIVAPVLIRYVVHIYAVDKKKPLLVLYGWLFFLISFFIGKYLVFSHFYSFLQGWIKAQELNDFSVAVSYLPYIFNKIHFGLFTENFSKLFDYADFIWVLAGFYIIWRHTIFSGKKANQKTGNKRKYFNRRFHS